MFRELEPIMFEKVPQQEATHLRAPAPQDIPLPYALAPGPTHFTPSARQKLKFGHPVVDTGYSSGTSSTSSTQGSGMTTPKRGSGGSGTGSTSSIGHRFGSGSGDMKSMKSSCGSGDMKSSCGSGDMKSNCGSGASWQLASRQSTPPPPGQSSFMAQPLAASAVMKAMSGVWLGEQGESYTLHFFDSTRWGCICCDSRGTAMVDLSFDEERGLVWWGKNKVFFLRAPEVVANDRRAAWYVSKDERMPQSPTFVWTRQGTQASLPAHQVQPERTAHIGAPNGGHGAEAPQRASCDYTAAIEAVVRATQNVTGAGAITRPAPAAAAQARSEAVEEAAAQAIREVTERLIEQGGQGKIWLPHWNDQYHAKLGPLRDFLQAQPDKFNVMLSKGFRKYSVALVEPNASAQIFATKAHLTEVAVQEVMWQVAANGKAGLVEMPDWKTRFSAHLGTLRSFLESRPEFVVFPAKGGKFRVARATWDNSGCFPGQLRG